MTELRVPSFQLPEDPNKPQSQDTDTTAADDPIWNAIREQNANDARIVKHLEQTPAKKSEDGEQE